MRNAFPPVNEKHSGFLSYAIRPLFPGVLDSFDGGIMEPAAGSALVQTSTLSALVQTGTLTALIQTGSA